LAITKVVQSVSLKRRSSAASSSYKATASPSPLILDPSLSRSLPHPLKASLKAARFARDFLAAGR